MRQPSLYEVFCPTLTEPERGCRFAPATAPRKLMPALSLLASSSFASSPSGLRPPWRVPFLRRFAFATRWCESAGLACRSFLFVVRAGSFAAGVYGTDARVEAGGRRGADRVSTTTRNPAEALLPNLMRGAVRAADLQAHSDMLDQEPPRRT